MKKVLVVLVMVLFVFSAVSFGKEAVADKSKDVIKKNVQEGQRPMGQRPIMGRFSHGQRGPGFFKDRPEITPEMKKKFEERRAEWIKKFAEIKKDAAKKEFPVRGEKWGKRDGKGPHNSRAFHGGRNFRGKYSHHKFSFRRGNYGGSNFSRGRGCRGEKCPMRGRGGYRGPRDYKGPRGPRFKK